jgi:hypothetical protein
MSSSRPRIASVLTLALAASAVLGGCAYKSSYRQTNFDVQTQPVPQDKVKVVKSKDNLNSAYTEIGLYRGRAPTVKEAMDVAKNQCGREGAELYILNVEPYESGGSWQVDGVCAVFAAEPAAE